MDIGERVNEVRQIARDPQRLFARTAARYGADLVVIGVATLDEVARLREAVETLLRHVDRRAARAALRDRPRTPRRPATTSDASSTEAT